MQCNFDWSHVEIFVTVNFAKLNVLFILYRSTHQISRDFSLTLDLLIDEATTIMTGLISELITNHCKWQLLACAHYADKL